MRITTKAQRHREENSCLNPRTILLLSSLCLCALVVNLPAAPPEPKFEPQTIDPAISIGYGVDIGDVDGDKRPDILLADQKQIVWYRNPGKPGEKWPKFVMAENLTERDNVCIAARDIDGDGKVEVAVGGNWNPGETTDTEKSGAIFYLIRPADPTQKWEPVQIKPHEPTTHRMRWMQNEQKTFLLVVVPLHGRGNMNGEGEGVKIWAYEMPNNPHGDWKSSLVDGSMHLAHNLDLIVATDDLQEAILIGGREGITGAWRKSGGWMRNTATQIKDPAGEVRMGRIRDRGLVAVITPMHGNRIVAYSKRQDENDGDPLGSVSLDETLSEGHALAVNDLLRLNRDQVLAGWRKPNADKKVGIRMYVPQDEKYEKWKTYTIDDNTMACEDLKVGDLDGDGKLDIVASGRATKNVIVYWNRTDIAKRP